MIYVLIVYILFLMNSSCGNVISSPIEKIKEGEYVYYNISLVGDTYLYLQLITISGDCDLYVSDTVDFPTYKEYSYCSATCGFDSVIIPKRAKDQVHIGLYGHPAFESNECYLNVCILENSVKPDEYTDDLTELSTITEAVIEEKCKKIQNNNSSSRSYLSFFLQLVANLQVDNIFVELLFSFMDSML